MRKGQVSPRREDLTGRKFGKLFVIGFNSRHIDGKLYWNCRCDCGTEKKILGQALKTGATSGCGCVNRLHGMTSSDEHSIWSGMLDRCLNPNTPHFKDYGGRGIYVCDSWKESFLNFYADMGARPSKAHSLDRRDVNGNYEPGNVSWVTKLVQANNCRNTRYVKYLGKKMPLNDAVRVAGSVINPNAAWTRIIRLGWPVEIAVETPRTRESPLTVSRRKKSGVYA